MTAAGPLVVAPAEAPPVAPEPPARPDHPVEPSAPVPGSAFEPADAPAPGAPPPSLQVEILGSGVFLGGTVPLSIGARYVIGRVGSGIRILGPVDTGPDRIVFEGSLDGSDATVVADRILLTGSRDQRGRSRWSLAFKAVVGRTPQELEIALRAPAGRRDDVPPGHLT